MKITYTLHGDYYLPDLTLTEQPATPLGKYGRMRKSFLKQHRRGLYNALLLTEQLPPTWPRSTKLQRSMWNKSYPTWQKRKV